MSKPDVWMPLYPGDYLADTRRLSLEQHGAYLLLILDYWRNGPPPDDEATLARIIGSTVAVWRRLAPVIRPLFKAEDGILRHKRIDEEILKATGRKEKAVAKAAVAAAARWAEHQSKQGPRDATSNAPSSPQALHKDMLEDCPSPSPSPLSTKTSTKALATPTASPFEGVRQDVWEAWARHCVSKRLKLTPDRIRFQSKRLAILAGAGHDPNGVLEHAIASNYQGLFAPGGATPASKGSVHDKRAAVAEAINGKEPTDECHDITAESKRIA